MSSHSAQQTISCINGAQSDIKITQLDDNGIIRWLLSNKETCLHRELSPASAAVCSRCKWMSSNWKKTVLFQRMDNMSAHTGFKRSSGVNISLFVYSMSVWASSWGKSGRAPCSLLRLSHICKHNGSYVQSWALRPPAAPLSHTLIVILA